MNDELNRLDKTITDRGFFERSRRGGGAVEGNGLRPYRTGWTSRQSQKSSNDRIGKLENFQAKILGLALAAPIFTALAVYMLTR